MILYLDTEFTRFNGDLMSLALVPAFDHVPALYIELGEDQFEEPSDWVKENVSPKMGLAGTERLPCRVSVAMGVTREVAARMLAAYLARFDKPVIMADWPEDLTQLLKLLVTGPGEMVTTPDFELSYKALRGFNTAKASKEPHHALFDAVALRDYCVANMPPSQREEIARIIDPVWFNEIDGRHVLDNYPDQHKKYQAAALAKADAIEALISSRNGPQSELDPPQ